MIWGVLHGVYQIIGALTKKPRERIYAALKIKTDSLPFVLWQRFWTFVLVCFSWIFFRANSFSDALLLIKKLFTEWGSGTVSATVSSMGITVTAVLVTVLSVLILSMLDTIMNDEKIGESGTVSRQYTTVWIAFAVAVAWCLLLSVGGASAFIYFQF